MFSRLLSALTNQRLSTNAALADTIEGPSIYAYTGPQRKMLRLYELLRDSLRFEKYYACRLKRLKMWNRLADISIAVSASGSLTSAKYMHTPIGQNVLTGTLIFSTVATILKPVLKVNDQIIRLSKLQVQYLELYQDLKTLSHEIQEADEVQAKHDKQLSVLNDRFNKLGLQNDPGESQRLMRKFQVQVESQIPSVGLWLPANATQNSTAASTASTADKSAAATA